MAKRRYRRFRRRHGRWSANIREVFRSFTTPTNTSQTNNFSFTETLATNPIQNTDTVSQTFTVKNFYLDFVLEATDNNALAEIESLTAYVMYVPQGMNPTYTYNLEHPEYILSYKYLGSPTTNSTSGQENQNYQPIRIRSRLSRKLQTGDKIVLFVKGKQEEDLTTPPHTLKLYGLLRWWSKAN